MTLELALARPDPALYPHLRVEVKPPQIDRTLYLRPQAIALVPSTFQREVGILANPPFLGKYPGEYSRDLEALLAMSLPEPENRTILVAQAQPEVDPESRDMTLIDAAKTSIFTINRHRGRKYNPRTDEEPGRAPHEILTGPANQERLREMNPATMPVIKDSITGELSMVNYFAGDATAKINNAIWITAQAIDATEGPLKGDEFLREVWPHVEAGMRHDAANTDRYGMGLLVTDPRSTFWPQVWRDGVTGYMGENGEQLRYPVVFFSNAVAGIKELGVVAEMASRLGEERFIRELNLQKRAETAREH
jgi:hypothetical protein